MSPIRSVAARVSSARLLTSPATTANPRPASPARAASIPAFNDSRRVCLAILSMEVATPPICLSSALKEPRRSSMWPTAPVRSAMCCTAPPINVRDSAISVPAADAACWASLAARSISRFPATIVSAARCSSLNCSAWLPTRLVTSSRLPATSASSTPREPTRAANSETNRPLSSGPVSFMARIMRLPPGHWSVQRATFDATPTSVQAREHELEHDSRSVATLNEQAGGTQRFGKLSLDPRGLAPGDVLQVQGRPRQHLQPALQNTPGSADARLVLVETVRRAVVTHPDIDAVRVRAAVAVVEQHQVDVRASLVGSLKLARDLISHREPVHITHGQPVRN